MDPKGKLFYAKLEKVNGDLGDKNHYWVKGAEVSKIWGGKERVGFEEKER